MKTYINGKGGIVPQELLQFIFTKMKYTAANAEMIYWDI
jgi:hypothetical protein